MENFYGLYLKSSQMSSSAIANVIRRAGSRATIFEKMPASVYQFEKNHKVLTADRVIKKYHRGDILDQHDQIAVGATR